MATRCYNCGNDPGQGDRCQVCDASQIPEPLGMFSTAPAATGGQSPRPATVDPTPPSRPSGGLWSTGDDADDAPAGNGHRSQTTDERFADIVDAAIVDDEDDYEPHHREQPREAPRHDPRDHDVHDRGAADHRASRPHEPVAEHSAQLGSIFDEDPGDATRSPFGRHANDAAEPEWAPEWSPEWPADEPASRQAPNHQPQYQVPPPSYPPPPPPPNPYVAPNYAQTAPGVAPAPYYQHPYQVPAGPPAVPTDPFAQAGVGAPQTGPGSAPVTPDQQGLASAVSKLAPASQHSGNVAFCVVGGLLATDEVVLTAVQGWALGMPTVAVLTNARVLVVSERRWKPLVEVFPLRPGLTIFGRHVDHQASVTFQEGDRVVTLDQVADVPIAVELATTARARSTGTGF